jgi:hypothetical protein
VKEETSMGNLRKFVLGTIVALASSHAVGAQNLLTNGDFDAGVGLTDWGPGPGTLALGADAGSCLLSDSAAATSGGASGNQYFAMYSGQCITVDPTATPTLFLGALYRTTAEVWARLFLQMFTDGACASFHGYGGGHFGATSANWSFVGGQVPIPPEVHSFYVLADFNPMVAGNPPFTGAFDRFYVGVQPQIFVDGFEVESGSACRWSSIVL